MKNLYTYLFFNKISCNTDITNTFNLNGLLLPSASFLALFGLTCFFSIIIYNNSFKQSNELIKKLNTSDDNFLDTLLPLDSSKLEIIRESEKLVTVRCNNYLNCIESMRTNLLDSLFTVEEEINEEIYKLDKIDTPLSIDHIILKSIKKQIFINRSNLYDYKGINNYLTGMDNWNSPFIKTEDFNSDVCEGLVEIEAYLNISKYIRTDREPSNKNYMLFFDNQSIIAQNIDQKKEICTLFKCTFQEEFQYRTLLYSGEAVSFVIDNGLFII